MSDTKTDNDNFAGKLALRRYFLRRYHEGRTPLVFDACQATGQLWKALRTEFTVTYFGVDHVAQPGRLRIESERVLATPGWQFDVIDVDTYGSPWLHWEQIMKHGRAPVTVFLTIGSSMFGGSTDNAALRAIGLGRVVKRLPPSMRKKLDRIAVDACLALTFTHGWEVVDAQEAPPGRSARYLGLHMVRRAASHSVPNPHALNPNTGPSEHTPRVV